MVHYIHLETPKESVSGGDEDITGGPGEQAERYFYERLVKLTRTKVAASDSRWLASIFYCSPRPRSAFLFLLFQRSWLLFAPQPPLLAVPITFSLDPLAPARPNSIRLSAFHRSPKVELVFRRNSDTVLRPGSLTPSVVYLPMFDVGSSREWLRITCFIDGTYFLRCWDTRIRRSYTSGNLRRTLVG